MRSASRQRKVQFWCCRIRRSFHTNEISQSSIGANRQKMPYRKQVSGNPPVRTVCGILMHSSLAVTPEGLPLGLAAITFWTRKKFKGCNALKKASQSQHACRSKKRKAFGGLRNLQQSTVRFNDPDRCIHVGDRESDIYELFCTARELGTHFLVRTCQDRLAGDGEHTMQ